MLKKLKSLFIVDEDDKAGANSPAETKDKIETAPEPETPEELADVPVESSPLPPNSKPDGKFVNVLLKAIDANNLEGFDYLEYKQSLQSLAKMDMDEATRYQSAFAMAKTMGATPKRLVDSAAHYLKVLDKENTKFKDALKNQRAKQVGGREQKVRDLEKSIVDKQKQIEKLTKEIAAAQQSLGEVKQTINQAAAKVELTNSQFQLAYQSVVGQIKSDMDKMKKFLK